MPSYKVKTKSVYYDKANRKTDSTTFYTLHTDNIKAVIDSVLERKETKPNHVNYNSNKKIIAVEVKKE